jgi:hypothetical protein
MSTRRQATIIEPRPSRPGLSQGSIVHSRRTHAAAELCAIVADNLTFSGWLDIGGFLVPVLLSSDRSEADPQRRVLALHGLANVPSS